MGTPEYYSCICGGTASPLTDIMRRMMLNETLTLEEARLYDRIMNMCVDTPTLDTLYVLITALNMAAATRGLKVNLSLRRPAREPKRSPVKGFLGRHPDVAERAREKWPNIDKRERKMGQIERELRMHPDITTASMVTGVHTIYSGARVSLEERGMKNPDHIDVMSEAIEAAEALGL
jgi:hypothetical protein